MLNVSLEPHCFRDSGSICSCHVWASCLCHTWARPWSALAIPTAFNLRSRWDTAVLTPPALLFPTAGETTKKKPWRERVCLAYLGFLCSLLRNVNVYERQEIFFFFTVVSVCACVCLHSDWCLLVFVFWCQHYLLTVSTARRRSLTLVCAATAASSLSLLHISCSFLFVCDRKQPLTFSCVFYVVIY